MVRDALKITLAAHIPKKYRTKKTESVQGVDRYLPTSEEHMALLQVMSARVSKQIRKKQVERQGRWKSKKTKQLFSQKIRHPRQ